MEEPATTIASTAPKLRPAAETQGIEEYLASSLHTLETARANVDIAERLYEYGMDDEELAIGMGLYEAARNALHSHKETANHQDLAVSEVTLKESVSKARETFVTFRGIARAAFTGLTERLNLKLVGEPPDDLQRFIDAAHASYMAASNDPYTEKLSKRGYTPVKLGGYCEELDALTQIGEDHAEATEESDKPESATERDDTYNAFKEFMKEFKGIAKTVFRKEPEQLQKLGL
jgi:hypothetical protein